MKHNVYSNKANRRHSRRHSRRVHRRLLTAIFHPITIFLAAAIILIFSLGIRTVDASNKDEITMYKYYTSITVQADDTLWDIAGRYAYNEKPKSYVSNLMKINNMSDTTIYSGQDIIIYYYSDELK